MSNILVSGLINIETTLRIDKFPLGYDPVRYPFFGINSSVSGVGWNIAKALTTLGNSVDLLSVIGKDASGLLVREALRENNLNDAYILDSLQQTAQSVIIYDDEGKRQIHVDLKNIQDWRYPVDPLKSTMATVDLIVLCNINFSRPLLSTSCQAGYLIATDVHAISDVDDEYNREFMRSADILFMSHERLPMPPEAWAKVVMDSYPVKILVIGLGPQGALIALRENRSIDIFPAVKTRQVINTIGAGDALFSGFVDTYLRTLDPYVSIRKALVFASYKIGEIGAAQGFLTAAELDRLAAKIYPD